MTSEFLSRLGQDILTAHRKGLSKEPYQKNLVLILYIFISLLIWKEFINYKTLGYIKIMRAVNHTYKFFKTMLNAEKLSIFSIYQYKLNKLSVLFDKFYHFLY